MKKRILNLGCGNETFGTHRADLYPTKTTTHVFDVEKGIQFPDNYFDVVYSKCLLEHLRNVGYHLEECYRVLKDRGLLILITDYAGCIQFYLGKAHEGLYEKLRKSYPEDRHYCVFTKQHLLNHLSCVGFKEINVKFVDSDMAIGRIYHRVYRIMRFFKIFPEITYPRIKVVARK